MRSEVSPTAGQKLIQLRRRDRFRVKLFGDVCGFDFEHLSKLPIYFSFLRSIDLCDLNAFVIEKDLHLIEQKLMRIRIRNVESEMVDQLLLLLLPFGPAIFTHLGADLLPELGWDRSETEWFVFLPATRAFEFITE
jgi:hypothetical protein